MALIAVGDPNQEIYGYTGAGFQVMEEMKEALGDKVSSFFVPTNYRSTKAIVEAANALIENNYKCDCEEVDDCECPEFTPTKPSKSADEGNPILIAKCYGIEDEAEYISNWIDEWNVKKSEVFVLCRTNSQASAISEAFRELNMDHKTIGNVWTFWDKKYIKVILAHLEIIASGGDSESLKMVLNVPSMHMVRKWGRGAGHYPGTRYLKVASILSSFRSYQDMSDNIDLAPPKSKSPLRDLVRVIDDLRGMSSLEDQIQYLIPMITKWQKFTKGLSPSFSEDMDRITEASRRFSDAQSMLSWVNYMKAQIQEQANENDRDKVTVGTIHSAKGLEADHVFVIGCCQGKPNILGNIVESSMPSKYVFVDFPSENNVFSPHQGSIEEERRLMYVAITRARKHLHLTWRQVHSGHDMEENQFIKEIIDGGASVVRVSN